MEDGDEPVEDTHEEEEEEDEEEGFASSREQDEIRRKKCCPKQRIDELATPYKRKFLALWNEHAYHLPKDKVKNLKLLLQRLYAMSPEETAKYFAELRAEARVAAMRKKLKQKLRKYLLDKHQHKQRERAYKLFKKLLKCGIAYAAENPVPPLVSIRLRYLSDIILEQICDLRKVEVPSRSNPDKRGLFLTSVADWMAIAVERLYYAAQLSINEITDQQQAADGTGDVPETYEKFGQPAASSTQKKLSVDQTVPKKYEDFGQPARSSTPKRLFLHKTVPKKYEDFGEPAGSSSPKRLSLDQTPKTYQESGEPGGSSSPKRLSHDPFYSFMTTAPVGKTTPKKLESKVPNYTFNHMKPSALPPSFFERTTIQMPPYGITKVSSKISQPVKPKRKRCKRFPKKTSRL